MLASGSYRNGVLAYHGNGGHSVSNMPIIVKKNSIVPDTSYRAPPRSTPPTTTIEPTTKWTWPTFTRETTVKAELPVENNALLGSLGYIVLVAILIME